MALSRKSSRPLSTIKENSCDDKEGEHNKPQQPSGRRIAVAPLEHPVWALSKQYLSDVSPEKWEPDKDCDQTGLTDTTKYTKDLADDCYGDKCNASYTDDARVFCNKSLVIKQMSDIPRLSNYQQNETLPEIKKLLSEKRTKRQTPSSGPDPYLLERLPMHAITGSAASLSPEINNVSFKLPFGTGESTFPKKLQDKSLLHTDSSESSDDQSSSMAREKYHTQAETSTSAEGKLPGVERRSTLDCEQVAWKNKVRESSSFTERFENRRPLRQSLDCFISRAPLLLSNIHRRNSHVPPTKEHETAILPGKIAKADSDSQLEFNFISDTNSNLGIIPSDMTSIAQIMPQHRRLSWHSGCANYQQRHNQDLPEISPISTPGQRLSNNDAFNRSTPVDLIPRRLSGIDMSALQKLKATTYALNLSTRRPSILAWRAKYVDNKLFLAQTNLHNSSAEVVERDRSARGSSLTHGQKDKISESLSLLQQELINIRLQDQSLARQFLAIRHSMNKLRLAIACEGHKELLDMAEEDMEDMREFSRLVDFPMELCLPTVSLQHIGVTRMNLMSRRFSTC